MIYLTVLLCLISNVLISNVLYAYEMRVVDGKIEVPLYTFRGQPVWTEAEKVRHLSGSVSSSPVTNADFVPVDIGTDREIINELNLTREIKSRTRVEQEIKRRKSRKYNEKKLIEAESERLIRLNLNFSTGTLTEPIRKYNRRIGR